MTTIGQPVQETDDAWLEQAVAEAPNEVHFLDLVLLVVREKRLVAGYAVACGLIAIILFYFLISVKYRSTTMILPPQQTSSRSMGNSIQDLSAALASSEGGEPEELGGLLDVRAEGAHYFRLHDQQV